ncbi:unnamed protein product [Nyctereutes procyonoides]|uniref:(raccoon dog) hypothetical protein n=1 Tax=Nyctereutes procyonoides TaxID=34880 RepID=A0A811Z0A8_NYCPR|nr:unnamed protein product [Nyctereutes procyonoides]
MATLEAWIQPPHELRGSGLSALPVCRAWRLRGGAADLLSSGQERPCCPGPSRQEPLSLVNLWKRNLNSGEEALVSRLDHCKHSQYHVDASLEKDHTLTPVGPEQAKLTGLQLASMGLKFNKIVPPSSPTRPCPTGSWRLCIMKTEPGSRPPSRTTFTGQTPSNRRTVIRFSSAMPTSSATSWSGTSCLLLL